MSNRVKILIVVLIGLLQIGDLVTTYMVKGVELNPTSQWFIEHGYWSLGLAKGLLVGLIAFFLWKCARVSGLVWAVVGIYCCVVGWNLGQLWIGRGIGV